MIPQIYLHRGKEESLLRRHPWVFSGAIDYVKAESEEEIAEGAVVDVFGKSGDFLARGHFQIGSIAVRVLSFRQEEIDAAWWRDRIAAAYALRRTLGLTDSGETTCYRLVHGEGDSLPGLVVDVYGTTAVVQCHSVGMYRSRLQIADALLACFGSRITAVYDKSSQTVPFNARLGAVDGYLRGAASTRGPSRRFVRAASCSPSPARRPSRRNFSAPPFSRPRHRPAAACASCTSSPSPPTTPSTFTTPKGSTSRGWCFTSNNHAYHPIFTD